MSSTLALAAGAVSTVIFASSTLPMVVKAYRTKDMESYSLPSLLMSNVGNLVHSVYVYSLPPGPIWALHAFYVATTAFMLAMLLRHRPRPADLHQPPGPAGVHHPADLHHPPHPADDGTHRSPDVPPLTGSIRSTPAGRTGPAEPEDHHEYDDDHDYATV